VANNSKNEADKTVRKVLTRKWQSSQSHGISSMHLLSKLLVGNGVISCQSLADLMNFTRQLGVVDKYPSACNELVAGLVG